MSALGTQVQADVRHKMQMSMWRFAQDRRCPACGKKAALLVDGFDAQGKVYRCRWCGTLARTSA